MRCPNCGNEVYERLDYAIVQCTRCWSLWDPYVYPGFPEINVEIGDIWDTSEPTDNDLMDDEHDQDDRLEESDDENEEEDEFDYGDIDEEDEDADFEEEFEDLDDGDEYNQEDDY